MFGVDVGGTFTDVVAIVDGKVRVTKVPSAPNNPQEAVLEGARRLGVENSNIFNHASTKGLNAVLTRNLPKVAFLTTEGHRDILDGGRSWRPFDKQMDPGWRRPFGDAARPLIQRYLRQGVRERMLASGEELLALDEKHAREILQLFKRCKVDGLAICLLNAYRNPAHEQRLLQLAYEELGDLPISLSSVVSPRAKEFSRATTTVIDVMMKLVYMDYADEVAKGLRQQGFNGELNFADCAGSLLPWQHAMQQPYQIIFAGPAAGIKACQELGKQINARNLLCCDVGGTSTDIGMILNGEPFLNDSVELEYDLLINALSLEVSSVGAGGGSIVSLSAAGDIQVGPSSAGAIPGPACYCRGGTLPTVTDACLLMGILDPKDFANGQLQLDRQRAEQAFTSLNTPLSQAERIRYAFRIALNNIAEEVLNIIIRHGADPRDYSLVAYGSAGPMLLAGALELMQVKEILIPPNPGLFSAIGLLSTDLVFTKSRSAYLLLMPSSEEEINSIYSALEVELIESLPTAIKAQGSYVLRRSFDGRLLGQSWETPFVEVPAGTLDAVALQQMSNSFHEEYLRRNGQDFPQIPVQGVTYRVELVIEAEKYAYQKMPRTETKPIPHTTRELYFVSEENTNMEAEVYHRENLQHGMQVLGPAIIQEPLSTILVMPGQLLTVGAVGELHITLQTSTERKKREPLS